MKLKIIILVAVLIIGIGIFFFYSFKPTVEEYTLDDKNDLDFVKRNLVSGGPPKDGIPSIDNPKYISATNAKLDEDAKIFGINYNDFIAAYPQNIMFWHEIANEEINGEKITISYCPLTESIIGYKGFNLGVSGELYNSNLVMYDRETNARIPQILGTAIEGDIKGKKLEHFPVVVTTWKKWKEKYPETLVLSNDTGFNRDYNRNPYPGYDRIYRLWFPVVAQSDELNTKDLIFGIENNDEFIAVLKKDFNEKNPQGLDISVGGENLYISYNKEFNVLQVDDSKIKAFETFWFAWYAYHPDTQLIK